MNWLKKIPPLLLFFLVAGESVHADRRREASLYLEQAVEEYRTGWPEKASFHLSIAENIDPDFVKENADAHRLRAMLFLASGDDASASSELVYSLRIRPDAFLYYIIGIYNLNLRSYEQARNAFRQAEELAVQAGPRDDTFREIIPFGCPAKAGDLPLDGIRRKPFEDPENFNRIWSRGLSGEETALSAFIAASLSMLLEPQNMAQNQALRERLKFLAAGETFSFPALSSLLGAPDTQDHHSLCVRSLEEMAEKERQAIATGTVDPSQTNLEILQTYLRRSYLFRAAWLEKDASLFSYGMFLTRIGAQREALHVFRSILPVYNPADQVPERLYYIAQIYRSMERAYSLLGSAPDSATLSKLAGALEAFDVNPTEERRRLMMQSLTLLAGQNLRNREALLLLREISKNDARRYAFYSQKIIDRDRQTDAIELPSAFRLFVSPSGR